MRGCSLEPVQPDHKDVAETALASELSRKPLRSLFGCESSHSDAVEASCRRLVILHEYGVAPAQITLQPVCILTLLKCSDLH